jgi:hypothetical protein
LELPSSVFRLRSFFCPYAIPRGVGGVAHQCSIWEYQILRSLSDLKNAENNFPFYSIDLAH